MPPNVWGPGEIRAHYNISGSALHKWKRHPEFPEPQRLQSGLVWDITEVKAWHADWRSNAAKRGRGRLVYLARQGWGIQRIATEIDTSTWTVKKWMVELGIETVSDEPPALVEARARRESLPGNVRARRLRGKV